MPSLQLQIVLWMAVWPLSDGISKLSMMLVDQPEQQVSCQELVPTWEALCAGDWVREQGVGC